MRRRRFELAAWQVYECGKPWREADADVAEAIDYCEFYGREMLRLADAAAPRRARRGQRLLLRAARRRRRHRAVELPAGHPVRHDRRPRSSPATPSIMKPAEQSAVIGAKLMEVFQEAGLPPRRRQLPAGRRRGDRPDAGRASRCGPDRLHRLARRRPAASTAQAAEMRAGQDHIKRVIAEMGGKNAIIVDDDADLDEAVHGVVASAFGYAGQKCSACSPRHRARSRCTMPSSIGWSRRRGA